MAHDLIETDPRVMMGKPVIKGTRITVELIVGKIQAGQTVEQLLEAHPRLSREAVQAAIEFAESTETDPTDAISHFGTIDFDPSYDYKQQRKRQ